MRQAQKSKERKKVDEQSFDIIHSDRSRLIRLVQDGEHRHDILVLILTDELSQSPNIIERSLRIRHSHHSVQKVDRSLLRRVIVAVLRSRYGVKIEIDAQTVLSCPGERLKKVLPSDVGEKGLAWVDFDDPVRNR